MSFREWTTPSSYAAAYRDAVQNGKLLPSGLPERISTPFVTAASPEYQASDHRLMIMGQESSGTYGSLAEPDAETAFDASLSEFAKFDLAQMPGATQRNSPFWKSYRQACRIFDVASPHGALWSNVVKVQTTEATGNSVSMLQGGLQPDEIATVLEWQQGLFREELRSFGPRKILAFMISPKYLWILKRMVPDLRTEEVPGYPSNHLLRASSADFGFTAMLTYHPAYQQRAGLLHLTEAAATLLRDTERA